MTNKEEKVLCDKLAAIERSRVTLFANGFISENENQKTKKRIKKWCDKNGLDAVKKRIGT